MKTILTSITALFVICHSSFVIAQGSLTPPGAPAPLFKTLDEVKPGTPISSLPFTISTPGVYYLTKSITTTSRESAILTSKLTCSAGPTQAVKYRFTSTTSNPITAPS